MKGKIQKPIPAPLEGICRKNEPKLLGITFNENPCNWDTQFENMMEAIFVFCNLHCKPARLFAGSVSNMYTIKIHYYNVLDFLMCRVF